MLNQFEVFNWINKILWAGSLWQISVEKWQRLTWCKLESEPHRHGHDAVVYHMQRGHMLVFLAQHEEKCVHELREFAEVVPPACVRHLRQEKYISKTFTSHHYKFNKSLNSFFNYEGFWFLLTTSYIYRKKIFSPPN